MVTVSVKAIKKIRDTSKLCKVADKPTGIWYAPGEDWINYLKFDAEMLEQSSYVYSLQPLYSQGGLESTGGVLQINNKDMLYEFHRRFAVETDTNKWSAIDALIGRKSVKSETPIFEDVNWSIVSNIWDGIEIVPYQKEVSDDTEVQWYHSWDVASGCIWRPAGLQNLQLLATRK